MLRLIPIIPLATRFRHGYGRVSGLVAAGSDAIGPCWYLSGRSLQSQNQQALPPHRSVGADGQGTDGKGLGKPEACRTRPTSTRPLTRRVEAGEQHRLNDKERDRAVGADPHCLKDTSTLPDVR